jgi:acetoin utilization protein AcuB
MDHIPSIASVMTPFPYVVHVDDSVLAARALMVEREVRHLPVKSGNTLVGVLTDRDLKRALDPGLGHLSLQHIGRALVTKNGRLAGIFTLTDAARLFRQPLRSVFQSRSGNEVARVWRSLTPLRRPTGGY